MKTRLPGKLLFVFLASVVGLAARPAPLCADPSVVADDLSFGVVGEDEFMDGYVLLPRIPVFWESDTAWRLTVSAVSPDLGISNDAGYIKPLDDLLWKLSDEEVWLPIRQDAEEVVWSTETGSGVVYVDIMVLLDWLADAPGEYRVDLVFTIGAL